MKYYMVFFDCEGPGNIEKDVIEIEWEMMTEEERDRVYEQNSQAIGFFLAGVFEATSKQEALQLAEQYIAENHIDVIPGA